MKNRFTITLIFVVIVIFSILGFILFSNNSAPSPSAADVSINSEGKQDLTLTAKGGYTPNELTAKAGVPAVLKVNTQGTYDCSVAFTIPTLGIRKMLPASGLTTFDIPPQKSGTTIRGMCSMGIYTFTITFN